MKKIAFRFLRKIGWLKQLRINPKIIVNNIEFTIPVINEVGFENYLSLSEPWMNHILQRLIGNSEYPKMFIDVGVNIGQTLIKVKSVSPTINYVGFEPNPLCVNYVNSLIEVNKFMNTEIIPVGIGDKSTVLKLKLFSDSDVDSAASIIDGFRDESTVIKTINVPIFKYSDIPMDNKLKIGIIKIDVEGAELEVINGFKDRILSDRPVMLVEILPAYQSDNLPRVSRQEKIQKLLHELDYNILQIIKKDNEFISVQRISEFGIHGDLNLCEFILAPSELTENITGAMLLQSKEPNA